MAIHDKLLNLLDNRTRKGLLDKAKRVFFNCFNQLGRFFARASNLVEIKMKIKFIATLFTVLICLLLLCTNTASAETVFSEDFEEGASDWSTDNGVWEIGVPTSGPTAAHSGSNVAATILDGNYPAQTDSRLVSPVLELPTLGSVNERIELRFWNWYSYHFGNGSPDQGRIQINVQTGGVWGGWTTLATVVEQIDWRINSGSDWSPVSVDLTAYAGKVMVSG